VSNDVVVRRVDLLLEEAIRVGGPEVRAVAAERRAALAEPLRLAVVGRVKAGKSTLVNALIGRRIAPTRAGECTRVVTWFQYGSPDGSAVVHCHDGREIPIALVDGRLPEELPVRADEVRRLVVRLQSAQLRDLTLIDTPGLSSLTAENEQTTRDALLGTGGGAGPRAADDTGGGAGPRAADETVTLASRHASGDADAVVFLFRHEQRQDESDFLRQFTAASGEMNGSAVNAIGVLSQADLLADDADGVTDPMAPAREHAARLAESRIAEVADVVAVSGLMAESARTGRIRERDVVDLAALREVAPVRLRTGVGLGGTVDPERFRALQARLGPLGVLAGRHAAADGSEGFLDWLADTSGVDELERVLDEHVRARAAGLKAIRALDAIERAARYTGRDEAVLDLVEQALMSAELQQVREIRAIGMLRSTRVAPELLPELERLSSSDDPAVRLGLPPDSDSVTIAAEARRRSGENQARATMAFAPGEAEAARVLAQSYQYIARAAEG
jgi:hypothetical protein